MSHPLIFFRSTPGFSKAVAIVRKAGTAGVGAEG
jgi:hypothetical protein